MSRLIPENRMREIPILGEYTEEIDEIEVSSVGIQIRGIHPAYMYRLESESSRHALALAGLFSFLRQSYSREDVIQMLEDDSNTYDSGLSNVALMRAQIAMEQLEEENPGIAAQVLDETGHIRKQGLALELTGGDFLQLENDMYNIYHNTDLKRLMLVNDNKSVNDVGLNDEILHPGNHLPIDYGSVITLAPDLFGDNYALRFEE